MEDNIAYSYHDVLTRNGFKTVEQNGYIKKLNDNQLILIDIYAGHWEVNLYSINHLKSDRLEVLILDKKDHSSIDEFNSDVIKNSLIQLQELSERMNLDIAFK